MSELIRPGEATGRWAPVVPLRIAAAGDQAARRYVEFFVVQIRSPNT